MVTEWKIALSLEEYPLDEKDESANQENIETKYLKNVASDSSKTVEPGEEEKETSTKRFINVDDESARKNGVASVQEKQEPTDMQPKDLVEAEESENEKVEEVEKDIKKKDESKGDLKNPVEGSQQSFPENENQENENKKDRKVDSGNLKDPEIKNAENEEQGKRSMSEKKDRSSTASTKGWEAEVVIDATGRSKSKSEGMKTGKEMSLRFQLRSCLLKFSASNWTTARKIVEILYLHSWSYVCIHAHMVKKDTDVGKQNLWTFGEPYCAPLPLSAFGGRWTSYQIFEKGGLTGLQF